MPQYEMAAVYSQRRDAAQSAADTFGIRHVVGSIDELVRHPDVDIVLVLTTGPQHEEAVRAAIAAVKTVYCMLNLRVGYFLLLSAEWIGN